LESSQAFSTLGRGDSPPIIRGEIEEKLKVTVGALYFPLRKELNNFLSRQGYREGFILAPEDKFGKG
jgi:hypothetical protein